MDGVVPGGGCDRMRWLEVVWSVATTLENVLRGADSRSDGRAELHGERAVLPQQLHPPSSQASAVPARHSKPEPTSALTKRGEKRDAGVAVARGARKGRKTRERVDGMAEFSLPRVNAGKCAEESDAVVAEARGACSTHERTKIDAKKKQESSSS